MHPHDLGDCFDQATSLGFLLTYTLACVLASGVAIARSLSAGRRARDAQDAIDGAARLRDGGSIVTGLAVTEGVIPLSVRLRETGREWRRQGRWFHEWSETSREVRAEPFVVATDGGERVRVEPQNRAILVDRMTLVKQREHSRERVAELSDGEEVAVTGTLRHEGHDGGGAYRSSGPAWVIEPPAGGVMIVSTEPLATRHRFWSKFLLQIAVAPLLVALAVNGLAYRSFYVFVLDGRPVVGTLDDVRAHTWHEGNATHVRHDATIDYDDRELTTAISDSAYLALHRGAPIALVATHDDVFLGREPGISAWMVALAIGLAAVAALAVSAVVQRSSLWWEQKRVITRAAGRL